MNAYEETWEARESHDEMAQVLAVDKEGVPWALVGDFCDLREAKLAAQAPVMARLLKRIIEASAYGKDIGGPLMNEAGAVLRSAGVLP